MRSDLVYSANREIPNRYQLCSTTSVATRRLHINSTPTGHTINRVLQEISGKPQPLPQVIEVPIISAILAPIKNKKAA